MSHSRVGTSSGPPGAGDPSSPFGEEQWAWLVVTHPRDPIFAGKQLMVSSFGFSIGTKGDDLAIRGASDTVATIECDRIEVTTPLWTVTTRGGDVEVNGDKVLGTQTLATRDRIRVLGHHFVFICGEALEQQFYEVIYHLTIEDFATGLHNARFMAEIMDREARRFADGGVQLSVGVVRFGPNLTLGTEEIARANEDLIRNFARHLRVQAPKAWILALIADGEIGVIAPDTAAVALDLLLREICLGFTSVSENPRSSNLRSGVADWSASTSAADLLEQARARCRQPAA
jgi:hypothetical protein